jgi:hypothetical protein
MPISGGSAKRQWYLFFGAYCVVFFFLGKIFFALRKISGWSLFRINKLFILFTEISLKSLVCLKVPPPKLKVSSFQRAFQTTSGF